MPESEAKRSRRRELRNKRYAEDPGYREKKREQSKAWYHANKERARATGRKWYLENHEKALRIASDGRQKRAQAIKDNSKRAWILTRVDPMARAEVLILAAKRRADAKGLPINLDPVRIASVIAAGTCEATGLPFVLQRSGRSPWAPSLDRIEPELGYTAQNTRVVVLAYNSAKGEMSLSELARLARSIVGSEEG